MADAPGRLFRESAGYAPVRRPSSLRRTSSIDVTWPEGRGAPGQFAGRGRDAWTAGGELQVLDSAGFDAVVTMDRKLLSLSTMPARPVRHLAGSRAGGGFRALVREALPEEYAEGALLYLLLDDLSGAALVSGWAWSLRDPGWQASVREAMTNPQLRAAFPDRRGICTGFSEGSSAFDPDTDRSGTPTTALVNPADPEGWHPMPESGGAAMRRARRMDIWREDDIRIEAAFQDSATMLSGGRAVVHEYVLALRAEPESFRITEIKAEPKVLPFVECPAAAAKAQVLVGAKLPELREAVLEQLRGTAGCTHLNDALRALADVPALLRRADFRKTSE